MLEPRSYEGASAGVALIRDGNGTRSFDTLMRYRNAAMAEFMRALRTLKALQAEQAEDAAGAQVGEMPPRQPRAPARLASKPAPNEPERRPLHEYVIPDQAGPTRPGPAARSTSRRRAGCRTNPSPLGIGIGDGVPHASGG